MWDFGQMTGSTLDDWYQELAPSKIILHNVKTGGRSRSSPWWR